jgi:hypothetical protein
MKLTHNGWVNMWCLWGVVLLIIALHACVLAWAKSKAINASQTPTIAATAIAFGPTLRHRSRAWLSKYAPSRGAYSVISLIWVLFFLTFVVGVIIADTGGLIAAFSYWIVQLVLYITIVQLLDYILDV